MRDSIFQCLSTYHYQVVAIILFMIGLLGLVYSRNLIKILISIEFIINSINLIFVSFATYMSDKNYIGNTVVIFVSAISALLLAWGLYLVYLIYKQYGTVDVNQIYSKYKEID